MTREEAKRNAEVMLAYADGKDVEYLSPINNKWKLFSGDKEDADLGLNFCKYKYRIKQEPTYRPFANKEECWAEMQKHQPFGWLKLDDMYINIICIHSVDNKIELSPENLKFEDDESFDIERMFMSFERTFNEYLFADGTPFGIREE